MSGRDWTLTVRSGPKVEHSQYATLEAATDELAARLDALAKDSQRDEIKFLARTIEPSEQVVARLELSGPDGRRGGVDLHGDGQGVAFRGRLRRRVIEARNGESAAHALRRELST